MPVAPSPENGANQTNPAPTRWWQWFLLYPAFAIALVTAMPEWLKSFEAWRKDIPINELEASKRQNYLWQKNLTCTTAPMEFFLNPNNLKVDATICRSGDVFVRIFTPTNDGRYYWVDVDYLTKSSSLSDGLGLIRPASAARMQLAEFNQQAFIICQRFLDQRTLLRVVNAGGACYDEIVDTFTGFVRSRVPSPCRQAC